MIEEELISRLQRFYEVFDKEIIADPEAFLDKASQALVVSHIQYEEDFIKLFGQELWDNPPPEIEDWGPLKDLEAWASYIRDVLESSLPDKEFEPEPIYYLAKD